ncbi:hypothetical protein Taro_028473 [Colocasia esculenta]|uniref:Pullulanase 1, chloroplastic n=1 Tax=Colocasia esculenta TaxID=4460 RepID=A0A843VL66_COLES|nr:hypothetical protein [Colocasia esculenta]
MGGRMVSAGSRCGTPALVWLMLPRSALCPPSAGHFLGFAASSGALAPRDGHHFQPLLASGCRRRRSCFDESCSSIHQALFRGVQWHCGRREESLTSRKWSCGRGHSYIPRKGFLFRLRPPALGRIQMPPSPFSTHLSSSAHLHLLLRGGCSGFVASSGVLSLGISGFSVVRSPPALLNTAVLAVSNRSKRRHRRGELAIPSCSPMPLVSEKEDSTGPSSPLSQDSLSYARAFWVSKSHIAWDINAEDASVYVYASKMANLHFMNDNVEGCDVRIQLEWDESGLPANVTEKFPHIKNYAAFKIPSSVDIVNLLKCQLAVVCFSGQGRCINATGLQLPGVLDDLFSYSGPLGAIFSEEAICLYLWAPTAHVVRVFVYGNESNEDLLDCVQLEERFGVWHARIPRNWEGYYYVYEVSAYHLSTLQIETCIVNDPYARGISSDGHRTLFINLDSDSLKPLGWDELADEKPELLSFSDISIYELHIRDFSAMDYSVDPDLRGGYLAFTCEVNSAGVFHLRKLSEAGLTHVHLLPSFHFAGVDDVREKWKYVDDSRLSKMPPDSDEQQAEVSAIQDQDGYNWGYNPVLWSVPKGSYARDPNGGQRTLEFRKMVQALNRIGLRVVLDVVYNHVHASGPHNDLSVLEQVVPGYYLRRNADGHIENSTCINNTASEHFMMERLIIDDLLSWAVDYKVDGFRFDLMGHIMKGTMVKAKFALQSLSKDRNRVDGSKIHMYGEGWDFGEVAKNGRGVNASQSNISGTGIGSFNDRIRDAILGGSPFAHPLQQGFITGLALQPNGHNQGDQPITDAMLAASLDHIQVALAANLRDFVFTAHSGEAIKKSYYHLEVLHFCLLIDVHEKPGFSAYIKPVFFFFWESG